MDVVRDRLGEPAGDAPLRDLIRFEMKNVAGAADLRSFEVPRDFIVELEPFTHENGLLSSVHKRMRPALEARYGERLEQLYAELERRQNEDLLALRNLGSGLSVVEKVGKALEVALGVTDLDVSQPYGFVDLGGDSLGATAFSQMLEDIFGVVLPVSAILSPAGNPNSGPGPSRRRGNRTGPGCRPSTRFMARGPARFGPWISTSRRSSMSRTSSVTGSSAARGVELRAVDRRDRLPRAVHVSRVDGAISKTGGS